MSEPKLRKQLQEGKLSGLELARQEGEGAWLPLHTCSLFKEVVPHLGNTFESARRRSLVGLYSHLGAFLAVLAVVALNGMSGGLSIIGIWGVFLVLHGVQVIGDIQEAQSGVQASITVSTEDEGKPILPRVSSDAERGRRAALAPLAPDARRRRTAPVSRTPAARKPADPAQESGDRPVAQTADAQADLDSPDPDSEDLGNTAIDSAAIDSALEALWSSDPSGDTPPRAQSVQVPDVRHAAPLQPAPAPAQPAPALPANAPTQTAKSPPPKTLSPFMTQLEAALSAVQSAAGAAGQALAPEDLQALHEAARHIDSSRAALQSVLGPDTQLRLQEELDATVERAARSDGLTREALLEQVAVLEDRLATQEKARVALDRLEAREHTLLHQLEAMRAHLVLAAVDERPPPNLSRQLQTLGRQLEASAEVDTALARARRAAAFDRA